MEEPAEEPPPATAQAEVAPPPPNYWNYYDAYRDRLRLNLNRAATNRDHHTGRAGEDVLSRRCAEPHSVRIHFSGYAGGMEEPVVEPPLRPSVYTVQPQRLWTRDLYASPNWQERSAARPALVGIDDMGQAYGTQVYYRDGVMQDRAGQRTVLARAGDLVYASLIYGFNSDDTRGMPIYAVVTDVLDSGPTVRSTTPASRATLPTRRRMPPSVFTRILLADGRDIPMAGYCDLG